MGASGFVITSAQFDADGVYLNEITLLACAIRTMW